MHKKAKHVSVGGTPGSPNPSPRKGQPGSTAAHSSAVESVILLQHLQRDILDGSVVVDTQPSVGGSEIQAAGWQESGANLYTLASLSELVVLEEFQCLELLCLCETNNKYLIRDKEGRDLFTAYEKTSLWKRALLCTARPFKIEIRDMGDNPIITLYRPYQFFSFPCCPCCQEKLVVISPEARLGTVHQQCSWLRPTFSVEMEEEGRVFTIRGPSCLWSCYDRNFHISNIDSRQVGKIGKQWTGVTKNLLTNADYFGIEFPEDAHAEARAVLLGAIFLIDFMYFENSWR